jgi:hypothetical protein
MRAAPAVLVEHLAELAEARAERRLLRLIEVLIAEQQNQAFVPGVLNALENGIVERPGKIDGADFYAEGG